VGPLWQILLLALVQGICEFLPISSDGHLAIVQHLIRFTSSPLITDIFLHLGTLLAVLFFFRRDWLRLLTGWREAANQRMILWLVLGSIPTALIGFLFKDHLERLFSSPTAAGIGFLITAAFLFASHRVRLPAPPMAVAALLIGVAQGLAIAPGVSRSGLTIALALILSQDRDFAFRFSFLLSIPAIGGALLLEWRHVPPVGPGLQMLLLGTAVAALVGGAALVLLRRIMRSNRFHMFWGYCLGAGVLVLLLLR
jgi:undecaprenyl-diphosphatase